ncbi:MAG: alpha/beta fold hydrolase [Actinomycetales bacterium]|nr:alpha/beta fold hydrolase [Actinomycetales bacterium]
MADIVLIHGFPLDASMWEAQVAALQAAGHRVLTPEVGGLGASTIPAGTPDVQALAEQVVAAMDSAGFGRAVIGGLSMGGYVAMAMLRVAPERVAGLVFMDTKAAADDPARWATRMQVAASVRDSNSVEALARTMPTTLISEASRAVQPALAQRVADLIRRAQPESVAWCQEAMASRPDSLTTLRSAGALPALVLCGRDDEVTPVSDHEQLVAALRDAGGRPEFVVVPGAGHLAPMEDPAAVSTALVEFLSR